MSEWITVHSLTLVATGLLIFRVGFGRVIGATLLCLGLLTAAHAAPIRVVGSDLLGADFARAVAEFSRQDDQPVTLDLQGTRPGLAAMEAGQADVGLFMLPPGEVPPAGLINVVLAHQVAVVVVPAASSWREITVERLREEFGAGGKPTGARLALAPKAGLAWPLFAQRVLSDEAANATMNFVEEETLLERVRRDAAAMAITGALPEGRLNGLRVLTLAASATAPAYAPTPEAVGRGDYPLRVPLYVTFRRAEAPGLRRFLRFLLSDEVAAALAPAHFVGLTSASREPALVELETMQ